jgi:hypothetical protein
MGILSDFVVADAPEATAIGAKAGHGRWPSHRSSGLTHLEVGLLHFAITGEDPSAPVSPPRFIKNPFTGEELPEMVVTAYLDRFACLDDRGESWVYEIPESLVEELGRATDLRAVASRWAANEELRGADDDVLTHLLEQIQHLARLARAQRKALLLWYSL